MGYHQADAAQRAAWRSSGKRPSCPQWHLLGLAIRSTPARSTGSVWSLHHLVTTASFAGGRPAPGRSASAPISTVPATGSNGSSIGSSNVVGSRRATPSLQRLPSSSLHPSGYGWLRANECTPLKKAVRLHCQSVPRSGSDTVVDDTAT